MDNKILEKFEAGVPSIGTFTHLKSMSAIECLGQTGLDFVLIDQEHSPVGMEETVQYLTAAKAAGLTAIVRIGEIERTEVLRPLDAGAAGVVVPGVETVEQVERLVSYAKFKPLGKRGYCMTRDGGWGYSDCYADGLEGYMCLCNDRTLLLPQCETVGCLENIERICAIEGVDGIMIGPYDLSIAMGMPGQFDRPEFIAAVERIKNACKASGKIAVVFTGSEASAKQYIADGFDCVIFGMDNLVLINGYKAIVNGLK